MFALFLRRSLLLVLCGFAPLTLMSSDSNASRDTTKRCPRDPRFRDPAYRYCDPASDGQSCGSDWKCITINVWAENPHRIVGSDCACSGLDKTIWSYLSIGAHHAQQGGPLVQNQSTLEPG